MRSNALTILAVGGAFAAGALGTTALGDDRAPWDDPGVVHVAEREDRDERDDRERGLDDRRIDGVRDDHGPDVDERDDEDDDGSSNGDGSRAVHETNSGPPTPAPAPAPAPVYDDYSDDGGYAGGGSDYGDS